MVHNNRKNTTTGLLPNQILLGYEPQLTPNASEPSNNDLAEERVKKLMENRDQATRAIIEAVKGNEIISSQYHVRDQVWLEGKNLKFPHQATKLNPKRYGPFRVIKEISPVAYQLQLPPLWNIHPMFHASLLSSYSKTPSHSPNFSRLPSNLINNEEEYEVEQIKAHRNFGRSKCLQYLIKWKGYPKSDNTWEDATDVHAPDLTKQYHKRRPLQKIKGQLLSLLHSSPFPLHTLSTTILNQPLFPCPYPRYHPSTQSPSIIHHQQSSSDLCSAYTCGRPISSTSSTLIGSTTTLPTNIPSSTGTTVRRNSASTTTNRSACPKPSLLPQPLAQPTWLSNISSPSPSLTPHQHQSLVSPSSISTYKHPTDLTNMPKCPQMHLSISQMPRLLRTVSLSWSGRLRVWNHLYCPVPLQPPWRPTLTSMLTFSEPLLRGSSQPSPNTTPKKPAKFAASKSKSVGSTTTSNIMKTYLSKPPMDTSRTTGRCPTSTSPLEMGSSNRPSGSRSWKTEGSPDSTNNKALMSPLMLSTCMRRLTQLGMARKTPSSCSPPGFMPSSSGPAVTSCTCSGTSVTLMTGGWLGRSPASTSLIKKPPSLPRELKSYMKSSI